MELHSIRSWRPFTNSSRLLSTSFSSQHHHTIFEQKTSVIGFRWREQQMVRLGRKFYRITARASTSSDKSFVSNAGVGFNKFHRTPEEPYGGGKSGSVSFHGLTHQVMLEERSHGAKNSLLRVLALITLISSLVLPHFFLSNVVNAILKDKILAETVIFFSSEAMFYSDLAVFLRITDKVRKPYLQYSPKRRGFITRLKGYLTSALFTMGLSLNVFAPLVAVYTCLVFGWPALVVLLPFLVACAAQFAFEVHPDKHGSSSWPLVPIIFEVYRLYQLYKATHFFWLMHLLILTDPLVKLLAVVFMILMVPYFVIILGVVCLLSLMTFPLRLFLSRPVFEKY